MAERCPHCGQVLPDRREPRPRVCADCGQPMGGHDKYVWIERNGLSTVVHRHCDNPTDYSPREEPPA